MTQQPALQRGRLILAAIFAVFIIIGIVAIAGGGKGNDHASAGGCVVSSAASPAQTHGNFAEYSMPHPQSDLMSPAIDAQGNIWFGEMGGNRLGKLDPKTQTITEWVPPQGQSGIMGIQVDVQGNVWYAELNASHIARFTPGTCQFHVFPLAAVGGMQAAPNGLSIAPDGAVWFTQEGNDRVGQLDPATGKITTYVVSGGTKDHPVVPYGIDVAHDGTVWFTELVGNSIDRLDPKTGNITRLPLNAPQGEPNTITSGSDGIVWFTEMTPGILGRVDPSTNAITYYPVPATNGPVAQLYDVQVDAHGQVWLTSSGANALFRFDPSVQTWTTITLPQAQSVPYGLVFGSNGAVWFTEGAISANRVGMYQGQ